MMIVKHPENQGPPPKQLMDAIAELAEDGTQSGMMLGSGPLEPSALGARVLVSGGGASDRDRWAFYRAKEVIGGYAQFELKSKEEAIEGVSRFMEVHAEHHVIHVYCRYC